MMQNTSRKFQRSGRSNSDAGALTPFRVLRKQLRYRAAHVLHYGDRARFKTRAKSQGVQYAAIRRICGDSQTGTAQINANSENLRIIQGHLRSPRQISR